MILIILREQKNRAYPTIALFWWFWPTTVAPLQMLRAVWLTNICDLYRRPVLWFVRQPDGVICVVDQFCDSPKPNFVHYVTWPPLQWCQVIMFPNSSSHKGFWVSDFYYEIEGAKVQFCGGFDRTNCFTDNLSSDWILFWQHRCARVEFNRTNSWYILWGA